MKRKYDMLTGVFNSTRSQRPKLMSGLNLSTNLTSQDANWISATKTFNFMINDPLVDWLKLYYKNTSFNENGNVRIPSLQLNGGFVNFLRNKGMEFETKVIKCLQEDFRNITVKSVGNFYSEENIKKTKDLMKSGTHIICSGSLKNSENKTFGIPDLLIRSDYIPQIFGNQYENPDLYIPAPFLVSGNFHYRVIDIKFSTLKLASDGIHLLNQGKIPAYKAQLCVYNSALSKLQGFDSKKSYILGRRWNYTKGKQVYSGVSAFEKLGVIDFSNRDLEFIQRTSKAISWYKSVLSEGSLWSINPPSKPELYPNMCVDSYEWNKVKEQLAKELSEITMLWQCGPKNRQLAFDRGVKSWKDESCCAKLLGLGNNHGNIVDSIIEINKESCSDVILPAKMNIDQHLLKTNFSDFYVDFETLSDICQPLENFTNQREMNIIFMIGIGWFNNETKDWEYRNFIAEKISYESEVKILTEFKKFIAKFSNPRLFYWHAEKGFWNKSLRRNNLSVDCLNWVDLCKIFKDEPITIKNCFNYGLKNIAKAMREHGMISTQLNSDCNNGMMAMVKAWNCYSQNPANKKISDSPIMKDIGDYNEFDCKVLYDIISYLRLRDKD